MWSKIKNLIIFVLIGGVIIVGYVMFMKKPAEPAGSLLSTTSAPNPNTSTAQSEDQSRLGQDFLNLLFSVKSINLDASVFDNPSFNSLKDSSIILIPDGTEGRPNPFAPIGTENTLSSADASAFLSEQESNTGDDAMFPATGAPASSKPKR